MPVRSAPDARWSGTQKKAAIVERGRSASVARVKQMRTTDANRAPSTAVFHQACPATGLETTAKRGLSAVESCSGGGTRRLLLRLRP